MGDDGGRLVDHVANTIASLEIHLERAIYLALHRHCEKAVRKPSDTCGRRAKSLTARLLAALPEVRAKLARDVLAAYDSDPAATGVDEIVACYPGLYAIAVYRVANHLLHLGAEVLPRMLTEHAHSRTGIDIHPGATIGESFFIDHGTGIVIGETSHIGNRVRIYQGVTLGALSIKDRGRSDAPPARGKRQTAAQAAQTAKRHPTIEDDAIIYANATILGGKTVIGQGAVVGGNAWITYSVPPRTRVGVGT
jgi:serine O-acetyltransferase